MNIVIPCGGLGERFLREGYGDPKPLIPAMGRPILFWLLEGLSLGPEDTLLVAYNTDLEKWRMEDKLRTCIGSARLHVVHLPGPTRGAAETVALTLASLLPEEIGRKTMLFDCDTFYRVDLMSSFRAWDSRTNMCVVFRDEGSSPIYSYSELDENSVIRSMKEKDRISPWANTGCYSFANGEILLEYCTRTLNSEAPVLGEFYLSAVISTMLRDGHPFRALCISENDFVCLGTPLQLRLFCATLPDFAPRRVCFDLDGTLVTHPLVPGDYSTVQPYTSTIEYARFLKRMGNVIIIQTARGMRSCAGNLGLVQVKAAPAVRDVLTRLNIPCDELYFGKPYAHVYIDDLAHNVCEDLQKATSFYQTSVQERTHNSLEGSTLKTLIKRSSLPLDGEIHWYMDMPASVRHFFPAFIRAGADKSWYEVERLECTTCSHLYVNECLTEDHLRRILAALETIHGSVTLPSGFNETGVSIETNRSGKGDTVADTQAQISMYVNYHSKLVKRYATFDYGRLGHMAAVVYDRHDE